MTLTFSRLLLVSLLAMTLVSQSFAGMSLACQEMSEMDHGAMQAKDSKPGKDSHPVEDSHPVKDSTHMNSEEHHQMMMASNSQATSHEMPNMSASMDCCEQDCQCPVTGFTSYAAETNHTNLTKVISNRVLIAGFSPINLTLSLPIKPPAIA